MNVLLFVMSLLMTLSIMTWSSLYTYRSGRLREIAILSQGEKALLAKSAALKYGKWLNFKNPNPTKRERQLVVGETVQNADSEPDQVDERGQVEELFGAASFYQKALEERADAVEALIAALKSAPYRPTRPDQVYNLDLKDPFLNELFYMMLKNDTFRGMAQKIAKQPKR